MEFFSGNTEKQVGKEGGLVLFEGGEVGDLLSGCKEVVYNGRDYQLVRGGDSGLLVVQRGEFQPFRRFFGPIGSGDWVGVQRTVDAGDPNRQVIEAVVEDSVGYRMSCVVARGLRGIADGQLRLECESPMGVFDSGITIKAPTLRLLSSSRRMRKYVGRGENLFHYQAELAGAVWGLVLDSRKANRVFGDVDFNGLTSNMIEEGVRQLSEGGVVGNREEGRTRGSKYRDFCRRIEQGAQLFIARGDNGDPVVGELLLAT